MGETNIFKVLADSQRRAILMMLRNERLNAGESISLNQFLEKGIRLRGQFIYSPETSGVPSRINCISD